MSFDEVVVPEVVVPDVVVPDVVVPEVVGPAVAVIIPTGVAAVVVGCNAPVTAGAISIGAGGFNPSCWLDEGGCGAEPPRTKFHEHVTAYDVPGGAPGKFAGVDDEADPLIVVCVAAPSIAGSVHSST
jgi:hypothetical protein